MISAAESGSNRELEIPIRDRAKHKLIPPCITTTIAAVVVSNDPLPPKMLAMVTEGQGMKVTTASSSVDLDLTSSSFSAV